MNRPDKANYMTIEINPFVMGLDEATYRKDIEKYCDELEREKDFVNKVVIPDYDKVQKELQMYQKALDIAYRSVVYYQKILYPQLEWKDEYVKKWKDILIEQAKEQLDD